MPLTKLLRENGLLLDSRSFIGYRKEDMTPHLHLKGEDLSKQREKVFYRSNARCQLRISPDCVVNPVWQESGELDHIQGGLVGRCDCLHNLQWACKPCHRMKHIQVRWTPKRIEAHEETQEQD